MATMVVPAGGSSAPSGARARRRRVTNWLVWGLCGLALALLVVPVVWILEGIVANSVPHWHWSVITSYQQGNGGGLRNAIEGTLLITALVVVVAGAVGIAGGVYLAEFSPPGQAQLLRGASEVLSGVPSIVLGYVGYIVLVAGVFHWGFSLAAAVIVLSVLVIPYIVKTTEVAILNVPTAYREGGEALGMRSGYVLRRLVLKPALPGIVTGLIVAAAISVGETAPLLYTAGYSGSAPTLSLTHSPLGYLTYAVFTFYNQPSNTAHQLANSAALLLILMVLGLIVVARIVVSLTQRHSPERQQRTPTQAKRRVPVSSGAPQGEMAGQGGPAVG
jgi:phosphate transport system permease protein